MDKHFNWKQSIVASTLTGIFLLIFYFVFQYLSSPKPTILESGYVNSIHKDSLIKRQQEELWELQGANYALKSLVLDIQSEIDTSTIQGKEILTDILFYRDIENFILQDSTNIIKHKSWAFLSLHENEYRDKLGMWPKEFQKTIKEAHWMASQCYLELRKKAKNQYQ